MADEPVHVPDSEGREPWARAIAFTLALNAVLVAGLTWVAVANASAARDEDRRAILQTVQTELVRVAATIQADSEHSNAAAYLVARAQAQAIAALGATSERQGDIATADAFAGEADTMVAAAEASAPVGFLSTYLDLGRGRFNAEGRQEGLIRVQDLSAVSTAVPDAVAREADRTHATADRLALLVVPLVGVFLLLTLARLVTGRDRLRLLLGAWSVMGVVVVVAAWLVGG